jgi:predicted transcriptional regulator
MDILHLQKVIRYFEYLRNTQELDYSDFKLGAVSYELKENLEELVSSGLIGKTDGNYTLTPKGKEIADSLLKTFDPMEHQKLIFAKQQLNDLPSEEVLYFMYKLIPSTQRNSTEIVRLEKKKNTLIRRLFLKGRINSTTAAKWLEMSEKDFLDSLPTSR